MARPNHQILQPPVGHSSSHRPLLDTSNSIRDRIKLSQEAPSISIYTVLRRGKDQAFAMTFDDEPQWCRLHRRHRFAARFKFENAPGGGTASTTIYDACQASQ